MVHPSRTLQRLPEITLSSATLCPSVASGHTSFQAFLRIRIPPLFFNSPYLSILFQKCFTLPSPQAGPLLGPAIHTTPRWSPEPVRSPELRVRNSTGCQQLNPINSCLPEPAKNFVCRLNEPAFHTSEANVAEQSEK